MHNTMQKEKRRVRDFAEAGQYRNGSTMFCHMLIIMLPIVGLIYGIVTYKRADDRELKSICSAMLLIRLAGMMIYLLYFTFLLKVAMKMAFLL